MRIGNRSRASTGLAINKLRQPRIAENERENGLIRRDGGNRFLRAEGCAAKREGGEEGENEKRDAWRLHEDPLRILMVRSWKCELSY